MISLTSVYEMHWRNAVCHMCSHSQKVSECKTRGNKTDIREFSSVTDTYTIIHLHTHTWKHRDDIYNSHNNKHVTVSPVNSDYTIYTSAKRQYEEQHNRRTMQIYEHNIRRQTNPFGDDMLNKWMQRDDVVKSHECV